jgi:hydrogenase/urease accessory protein HupE
VTITGRRLVRWLSVLVPALTVASRAAQAHLVSTGLGPVYDGVAHFGLTPEDLIPVLGLAILAGLRGPAHGRAALFALPAAWLIGGVAGEAIGVPLNSAVAAASFLTVGGLVALDASLPPWAVALLAMLIGALHGYTDGSTIRLGNDGTKSLLGMVAAVFTVFAVTVGLVLPLRSPLTRTAMRVSGSWVAAAGLLLLGWVLRGAAS